MVPGAHFLPLTTLKNAAEYYRTVCHIRLTVPLQHSRWQPGVSLCHGMLCNSTMVLQRVPPDLKLLGARETKSFRNALPSVCRFEAISDAKFITGLKQNKQSRPPKCEGGALDHATADSFAALP